MGMISLEKMKDFFKKFPKIKLDLINEIISNPYDHERDDFVIMCQNNIPYLQDLQVDTLKKFYYDCKYMFLREEALLFDAGERCQNIYILLTGSIDVQLTDGDKLIQTLDTLGPGSLLGMNFVLKQEPWYYRAKNNTVHQCFVMKINIQSIINL